MYYSAGNKSIISLNLQHKYFTNDFIVDFNSNNQIYHVLPFYDSSNLHFLQFKRVSGNEIKGKIEYIYLLNKQNNIRLNFGSEFADNKLLLDTKQFLPGNNIDFSDETVLNNTLNKNLKYYYSALKYKTLIGKLTAMAGIKLHYIISENEQKEHSFSHNETKYTPDVYLRYNFLKTRNITFNYNASPQFVEISKLSEAYSFYNYNTLVYGNPELTTALYHGFLLNYMDFNSFSFSETSLQVNYSRQINPTGNSTEFADNNYITRYINASKPKETFSSDVNYEKRIKKFKLKINNQVLWTKYENIIDSELINNQSFSHSYRLSVSTYFKNAPNFEIGSMLGFNNYYQDDIKSIYSDNELFANIEIPFLKQFIFTTDYSYNINKNLQSNGKNYYSFLNANIYYKTKNNSWEFSISARNILNTKSLREVNETDLFIYSSDYFVMPVSVLFSVVYKL